MVASCGDCNDLLVVLGRASASRWLANTCMVAREVVVRHGRHWAARSGWRK